MTTPDFSDHIKKVLDLSISHIPKSDDGLLHRYAGDDEDAPLTVLEYLYGYLISAWHHTDAMEPEEIEEFETNFLEAGFSQALLDVLKLACGAGCTWVQLDRDGETITGLPVFPW